MATLSFTHHVDPKGLANYLLFRLQDTWPGAEAIIPDPHEVWRPAGDPALHCRPSGPKRTFPAFPTHYWTGPVLHPDVEVTVGACSAELYCEDINYHPVIAEGFRYLAWLPVLTAVHLQESVGANTLRVQP